MIAIEILVGIIIATVILTGIVKIGAPLVDAFADRLKLKFQELEPEEERKLKARIAYLEEELRSLKQQVSSIQDSTNFAIKLLEEQKKPEIKLERKKD